MHAACPMDITRRARRFDSGRGPGDFSVLQPNRLTSPPCRCVFSRRAYSLSQTMSHDNVVGEAQMREHMASPSLPSLANQWHYYLWIYEMCVWLR